MKRTFLLVILAAGLLAGHAQAPADSTQTVPTDTLAAPLTSPADPPGAPSAAANALAGLTDEDLGKYKLYPTKNMWTFLKLDTSNGKITIVQWGLERNKRFEYMLSDNSLVWDDDERNGRFELYPTTNTYNFLLLDRKRGRAYQVQWSFEEDERSIVPIF